MSKTSTLDRLRVKLRDRYFQSILGGILIFAMGLAYWSYTEHTKAAQNTAMTMAQQVQRDSSPWLAHPTDISVLLDDLRSGAVSEAVIGNDYLYVTRHDGRQYTVNDQAGTLNRHIYTLMSDSKVPMFTISELKEGQGGFSAMGTLDTVMRLLIVGFLLCMGWPMLSNLGLFSRKNKKSGVSFADVVGCGEAKRALMDIAAAQHNPAPFEALGARPPRGVLLTGEPGTGKTQLAKALATECGVNFIDASGSDFSSMFYGAGIMKVKALFRNARRQAPCIVFIDEIDGIGRRATEPRMGEAEGNRIINQFLTELDGFASNAGVLIIGATNLADSLDPALRREGRFDRTINVPLPTMDDRKELLKLYLGKLKSVDTLDIDNLASNCMGLTPAAIAAIVNQSALIAARASATSVQQQHVVDAIETRRIGEQPVGVTPFNDAERNRIAVHEAGHALVAAALGVGRVDKVTILPRGQALGVTLIIPVEDKRLHLKTEMQNQLMMLLAGRSAEKLFFKQTSSGAAMDLKEATRIALTMVGQLGMGPDSNLVSLPALRDAGLEVDARDTVRQVNEVLRAMESACDELLLRQRTAMDKIVAKLLTEETIPGTFVMEALAAANDGDFVEDANEVFGSIGQAACSATETV